MNIGENPKTYEFEPIEEPAEAPEPIEEPEPAEAPAPLQDPVPV